MILIWTNIKMMQAGSERSRRNAKAAKIISAVFQLIYKEYVGGSPPMDSLQRNLKCPYSLLRPRQVRRVETRYTQVLLRFPKALAKPGDSLVPYVHQRIFRAVMKYGQEVYLQRLTGLQLTITRLTV